MNVKLCSHERHKKQKQKQKNKKTGTGTKNMTMNAYFCKLFMYQTFYQSKTSYIIKLYRKIQYYKLIAILRRQFCIIFNNYHAKSRGISPDT